MIEFNNLHNFFSFHDSARYKKWIQDVLQIEGKTVGDIIYVFCDDDYLIEINRFHLDHDTFTDIITFPTSTNSKIISGDIFISIERVLKNASDLSVIFDLELSRVIIHGILHMIGYSDRTDEEKKQMRSKEDYYLSLQPEKN